MQLIVRTPVATRLATHIDKLWYCEYPEASGAEVVAPTGASQIVVPFADDASSPVLAGVFTAPQPIDARDQRRACGVVFRLGHSGAFVRAPIAEFTDTQTELDPSIWRGSPYVAEQLADAGSADVVFETLERLLLEALLPHWDHDPTVIAGARLLDQQHGVGQVIERLEVDRRRFGTAFTQVVGVGPKQFARTRRFQHALRVVRCSGDIPLGQLAADLGYSDQAHMTREFREFAAATPGEVHGATVDSPGHFAAD